MFLQFARFLPASAHAHHSAGMALPPSWSVLTQDLEIATSPGPLPTLEAAHRGVGPTGLTRPEPQQIKTSTYGTGSAFSIFSVSVFPSCLLAPCYGQTIHLPEPILFPLPSSPLLLGSPPHPPPSSLVKPSLSSSALAGLQYFCICTKQGHHRPSG